GEEGFTARSGVVPIAVRSREPIAKTDLLRYGEAESRIVDLDVSRERRQTQAGLRFMGFPIRDDTDDVNWRRGRVVLGSLGIEHLQAARFDREPQAAVQRPRGSRSEWRQAALRAVERIQDPDPNAPSGMLGP